MKLNAKELKKLTGCDLPISAYSLIPGGLTPTQEARFRFDAKDLIGRLPLTYSNDPRYDKKEPIMFAVNQIQKLGLNRDIHEEILSSKPCIKKEALVGEYFFYTQILTPEQLKSIEAELTAKNQYHTQQQTDIFGDPLPDFINFGGNKNVLASKADYTKKK